MILRSVAAGLLLLCPISGFSESLVCTGAATIAEFRLVVEGPGGVTAIPLARINQLHAGSRLRYEPAIHHAEAKPNARVGLILAPTAGKEPAELALLETRPANKAAEWLIPFDVSIVGVVFGAQGLDVKKVHSLVNENRQLIAQLADYAQRTSEVGALVESLAAWENRSPSTHGLDAVLSGFSSRYGVALPKMNMEARPDEQATLLLRSLLPSLASYDPLTTKPSVRVQQSAGLAASVASLFFGSPVTLAVGATALFQNLRSLMFPDTDFRSAFAQLQGGDQMSICSKPQPAKSRTRTAYLWALRLPASGPPDVCLAADHHLPAEWKSTVRLTARDSSQARLLPRVQEWQLTPLTANEALPINIRATLSAADILQLDLTRASAEPGAYRLVGKWDWNTFEVGGVVHLYPLGDLAAAKILPASEDRLIEGSGVVAIELAGTNFQFVENVLLLATEKPDTHPTRLRYTIVPRAKNPGDSEALVVLLDTNQFQRGDYHLRITQVNGESHSLPLKVHPPLPELKNLPLRANLGQSNQTVLLAGSQLERVDSISGRGMSWTLAPQKPGADASNSIGRTAVLNLDPSVCKGDRLDLSLSIRGLHQPLQLPGAVEVVGPRPVILNVERSIPSQLSVDLRSGEIPAGLPMSFVLHTENLESPPTLGLTCRQESASKPVLMLQAGKSKNGTKLDLVGEGKLFLSLDPGSLGSTGCDLTAVVESEPAGSSTPFPLGRVIRVPQIEKFELTEQVLDGSLYAGVLTGRELQTIEKAGWDARQGYRVSGIPTPRLGDPELQTLKVALPWPAPSPHAHIFVWLRGEAEGRATSARF